MSLLIIIPTLILKYLKLFKSIDFFLKILSTKNYKNYKNNHKYIFFGGIFEKDLFTKALMHEFGNIIFTQISFLYVFF